MFVKILITILIACSGILFSLQADAVDVSAKSSVLIEAKSKEVLLDNNCHNQMPMASTTKIMTSLLAIEAGIPNAEIETTEDMLKVEGTSMGLLPGDFVSMRELVYGMLLESGNDAANVVAYKLGGSKEKFAIMMNNRARQIGMKNTNFVTPSGLDADGHHSTAYDMALLGAQAISNPEFRSICSCESKRVEYGNPPYMRTLSNHNSLLKKYPYAIGIKTGFTKKSRRCLVSAAEKDGIVLVAVTLNASNDWDDHIKMYEYGFSQYKCVGLDINLDGTFLNVVGSDVKKAKVKVAYEPKVSIDAENSPDIKRVVTLSKFEYAPIKKGKVVGKIQYYLEDDLIGEASIVTDEDIKSNTEVIDNKKKSFLKRLFN